MVTESRSHSPAVFSSSPKATFLRRASTGNNDGKTVQVRGNMNDMREHLKHLGPSNLASRPKTTRYQTVKIKPGHGQMARTDSRTDIPRDLGNVLSPSIEPYRDMPAPGGGEGEGLLASAGREASDGVHALQQGYGSINVPSPRTTQEQQNHMDDTAAFGGPNSQSSSDTLGSLHSRSSTHRARKKGTTRSGSITENIIEAGGIRKVVLETNSSSNDTDDEEAKLAKIKENTPSRSFLSLLDSRSSKKQESEDDLEKGEGEGQEEEIEPEQPLEEGVKKKSPKRRKRKKNNKSRGENSGESQSQG